MNKRNADDFSSMEETGIPGQMKETDSAPFENAEMASEGSQFGVNYYNKVQDEQ